MEAKPPSSGSLFRGKDPFLRVPAEEDGSAEAFARLSSLQRVSMHIHVCTLPPILEADKDGEDGSSSICSKICFISLCGSKGN